MPCAHHTLSARHPGHGGSMRLHVSVLAIAALLGLAPSARAVITLGCPTFGAGGGPAASSGYSLLALAAEPVVGVAVAPPLSCASGFVACLEGRLAPLDAPRNTSTTTRIAFVAPNPSRGLTTASFALQDAARVSMSIFDSSGRRVRTLLDGWLEGGNHQVTWNGVTDGGTWARPGVYYLQLQAGSFRDAREVVLTR